MTKTSALITALLLALPFFQTGCTDISEPPTDAQTALAQIKYSLRKASKTSNPKTRIQFLRHAYENNKRLETEWPDPEKVPAFLKKYGDELERIPEQVYELSMQTRDMDSFKWAFEHSNKDCTQYAELLKVWKMGKQWQDFFISKYPEKTLPIFMNEALDNYNIRFFNQYIGDFKASGYRLEFPLGETEFNVRFYRFFAKMIKTAMQKEDTERIGFLIDHMPESTSAPFIDPYTKKTMQELGDYICHELKDETLACELVELGYNMNRVDLAKTGFGRAFSKALEANPEHAIIHVLKLNEWHGALSAEETAFLLALPNPLLRLVHKQNIAEAIKTSIKNTNTNHAFRLIKIREEIEPLTPHDYDQLLGWSLEYKNRAVFDYVKREYANVNIYQLNLAQLAGNRNLFRQYAPKILKKIYRTMNKTPKSDGTTFGRIHDLLISHHPEAVLYVVKNHDLGDEWTEIMESRTLLMDVCEGGNLEAAKYLVERKGANVLAQTDYTEMIISLFGRSRAKEGRLTPMFFAAKSGNCELIEYLDSKRANVNDRSAFGATPLMYAVDNNQLEAVKTLISLGANVNATMDENLAASPELATAYRRAKRQGNEEVLTALKKAGARP